MVGLNQRWCLRNLWWSEQAIVERLITLCVQGLYMQCSFQKYIYMGVGVGGGSKTQLVDLRGFWHSGIINFKGASSFLEGRISPHPLKRSPAM